MMMDDFDEQVGWESEFAKLKEEREEEFRVWKAKRLKYWWKVAELYGKDVVDTIMNEFGDDCEIVHFENGDVNVLVELYKQNPECGKIYDDDWNEFYDFVKWEK